MSMHMAPRAAAWEAWAVWTCKSWQRVSPASICSQERADLWSALFFARLIRGHADYPDSLLINWRDDFHSAADRTEPGRTEPGPRRTACCSHRRQSPRDRQRRPSPVERPPAVASRRASGKAYAEAIRQQNVMMAARDGTMLATDIYRPGMQGRTRIRAAAGSSSSHSLR